MPKGTTKSLGQKDKLDKFYTKTEHVKTILNLINLSDYDIIIEPSAGDGAFSKLIPNCIALDISPEDESIIKQDFLSYYPEEKGKILLIGNPPFGQQCNLAIQFFNHGAEFATAIAFILPKSFKKNSIQNRLNLNFALSKEIELPSNAFLLNGENYDVPCVFQLWERISIPRKKFTFPMTSNFISFTKDPSKANFRIQRVGGNAGKAFADKTGAISSNYYIINTSNLSTEDLMDIINKLNFPSIENTVGPKSLPKGELIYELEQVLNQKVE